MAEAAGVKIGRSTLFRLREIKRVGARANPRNPRDKVSTTRSSLPPTHQGNVRCSHYTGGTTGTRSGAMVEELAVDDRTAERESDHQAYDDSNQY